MLFWFLILGITIGIQVSVLSEDTKIMTTRAAWSLFFLTLGWVVAIIGEKLVKLYFPKIKISRPTIILVINAIRIVVFIAVVLTILEIWGITTTFALILLAVAVLVAALALRNTVPDLLAGAQINAAQHVTVGDFVKLETGEDASPVARVGIEKVSMKTDLIPPERMKLILVESARARLLNEVRTFVCTKCWDYMDMIRMHDLPQKPVCPKCGSSSLGVLRRDEDVVLSLVDKRGEKLTKSEDKISRQATKTARLLSKYGKPAAVALCGRNLKISDAKELLEKENMLSDHFFELIIEAERQSLKRKFW